MEPETPATSALDTAGAPDAVEQAVTRLEGIADRPLEEHPDVYQQVHETLRQALSDIPS